MVQAAEKEKLHQLEQSQRENEKLVAEMKLKIVEEEAKVSLAQDEAMRKEHQARLDMMRAEQEQNQAMQDEIRRAMAEKQAMDEESLARQCKNLASAALSTLGSYIAEKTVEKLNSLSSGPAWAQGFSSSS